MFQSTRTLLTLILGLFSFALGAQTLLVSSTVPDELFVCNTDNITITLQSSGGTATSPSVTVTLPAGVSYVPASVSGGGAAQSNISNLSAPVFTVPNVAPGSPVTFSITLTADCSLVDEINNGQQFFNTVTAVHSGGQQQQGISDFYKIDMGFVNIISVTPPLWSGESGEMVVREITLQNTRPGPISSLSFRDLQQAPGLAFQILGVGGTQTTPILFEATIPSSYFTAFGDGDNLFERDEVIIIREKVTVEDCGNPSFANGSTISIGWGCGSTMCQMDVDDATTTILPSTKNPNLSMTSVYQLPPDACGQTAAIQEVIINNTGSVAANDVQLECFVIDTGLVGIAAGSFEINTGSGWQPLVTESSVSTILDACAVSNLSLSAIVTVPSVPVGTPVRVRFKTYYCNFLCSSKPPRLRARYQYVKLCPQNSLVNGGQFLLPPNKSDVRASVSYNIGECLNDGDVYDSLIYSVQSSRLLAPATGFLRVQFKLPWGLYWDPTCSLVLGGKSPLSTNISTVQNEYSTVDLLYPLPFATDSVFGRFCLKYECDTSVNCVETIPNPPDSGDDFTIFPPGTMCDNCVLISEMTSAIVPTVNTPLECALTACDAFPLTVNNTCGAGGGGGGGGGGGIGGGNLTKLSFKSYRTNLGLKDDDDNREADEPVAITTNPNIRRNRYMVGDTMRTELGAKVVAGTLPELAFRIFNETWFSDMGKFDSDGFIIDAAKPGFVDSTLLNFLGSNLQIFTADGQQKTCPLNGPTIRSDQHLYTITPPNIRPPSPVDIVANMFDQYEVNFEDLAGNCNGYIPKQGDSILISTDYKFMMNFVPLIATSLPPLVNFRTQACGIDNVLAWTLGGCIPTDTIPNQYSGYIEEFTPPVYAIGPCDTTEAKQPAVYMIRIARGNMFPNEVRNLTSIVDYRQNFPQGVPHISSQVDFLNLQENDQKFGLTPLPTPTPVSGLQRYNISSFFAKPLDEGYRIQISSKFGKACSYAGNTTLTSQIRVKYKDKCFHDPTDQTYTNSDPNGFQNGSAELNMILSGTVFELPSENFEANFFIRNNTQYIADNAYLWVEANGLLEDIQILQQPSGNPVIQAGGVFQLGNIDPFGQPPFKIVAKSKICDPITVTLHYGWDCDPLAFTQGANTCGSEKKEFIITPIKPELDLSIIVQDTVLSMCDESDYIEFEVFNADDGVAYGVVASVLLPPGMVIVPNSSGLSFPSGVSYTAMGNPVQKPGNVWEWTPNLPNGLAGAEDEPLDRFKIRFRVETQCGFVANSQMFYGTEAIRSCGALSNITRKPGGKLQLEGLTESYNVQANLGFATPPGSIDCAENTELKATIVMGSTPMATDSIYVILPAGISYVAGSYDPDGSAPAGPPQQIGQQLQLPLPGNLGVGQAFTFNFKVQYDDPTGCGDKIVVLQTRERKSVFCPTINANCDVYVATGETFLPLNAQNPNLRLNNFSTSETGGSLNFSAELENIGSGSAFNPNIKIYLDTNGNGQVDATDQLVTNYMGNLTLAGGATAIINGTLPNLSADDLCKLLAFVPAMDNCGCDDQTIPLGGMSSVTHAIGKCGVSSVDVGLTNVPGHTYTWLTTNGLSCINCSMATYTPGINVSNGEVITLVLEDKTPNGCVVQHRYEIKFGGLTTFDIPDQTICEGEYVALSGPPATTYNWTGPGITQANQQTQYLQPTLPVSNYFLTITIVDGATTCTKNISTKVTVLQRDTVTLTPRTTCQGNPVNMYGTVTDEPGIYFGEIQQDNGCIGLEIQELIVLDSAIHETIPLCPGDSVQVLDSVFTAPGVYIENTFINGCPALHYYNVVGVDGLNLPSRDSVIIKQGDDAVLDVPNNLAIYDWMGDPLSCKNCFDPIANPDKTTDYMLFATDGNGCKDTLTYRVLVFPPCDASRLKIPNAFTPNGDTHNDLFKYVPFDGFEKIVTMRVYNRWGQKVWTGGPNEGWDGKIDGKDAPTDVYVWILVADCDGEQKEIKGEVTLIR